MYCSICKKNYDYYRICDNDCGTKTCPKNHICYKNLNNDIVQGHNPKCGRE